MKTITWKTFIELTELYTFSGNICLILVGVAFALHWNGTFNALNTLIYTVAIFFFHIFTNAFNNLKDYQNASDAHDYKEKSNTIGRHNLPLTLVRKTSYFSALGFVSCGFYFIMTHNWLLMLIGILGFGVGIFYSTGPIPINTLPLAEIIAAGAMGFLVPLGSFLTSAVNLAEISWWTILEFLLICGIPFMTMFNALLANNTCDLEEDIENGRKTLVYYLKPQRAVFVFKAVVILMFLLPLLLKVLGIIHGLPLLLLLYFPFAWSGLQPYFDQQLKMTTFPLVILHMERILHLFSLLYFLDILF